ncbi:MAG: glycosyltransferase [Candidatus Doudnabacteria bacterium]|nr:glycosyltransferase [Candidatus Doudnabacteria bacterium]
MKIALVHEFLTQLGGAERVLQNFLEIWPHATIHVLIYDKDKTKGIFEAYDKRISFLERLPLAKNHHRWFLALMPSAVRTFDFSDYDLILSDASSFAKGVKAKGKLHICYCHTPTRFLWTEQEDYLASQPYPFWAKWLARPVLKVLKKWDYFAAQGPDFFVCNSENVKNRIKKYYKRDAEVIWPPVDTELFHPEGKKENYFFVASRLEPYKKIELVVSAFNELGLPLKVAGSGTNSEKLRAMARSNIEFLGRVSDEELRKRYSEAQAFIFPAEEDAGIMMLEAQACGTPVITYRAGGAVEIVKEGVTGKFFETQSSESIKQAIQSFDTAKFDPNIIRQHAQNFDKKIFQKKIKEFVEGKYQDFKHLAS